MVGSVPAAGHRPQVQVLLSAELRDGGELSIELGGAARQEVRYDAAL
jgi:hypothetical protein